MIWNRYNHYLIEKSLCAEDAIYIDNEEANDQIEKIKTANQDLINSVSELSNLVKETISKTKETQLSRRQKRRNFVTKSFTGELNHEEKEIRDIIKEKKNLHNYLKSIQNEIHAAKSKIQKMGGLNELTDAKNQYKAILNINYDLLSEIALLKSSLPQSSQSDQSSHFASLSSSILAWK